MEITTTRMWRRATGGRLRLGAAVVALAALLLTGCAETSPTAAADMADEAAQEAPQEPEAAAPAEEREPVRIVFTGEDGSDGCEQHGPQEIDRGRAPFELENASDQTVVLVLFRFAAGHGYDDMIAQLGDEFPNEPEDANPTLFPWLDGGWRALLEVDANSAEALDVTVTPGEYGLSCWVPGEPPKVGWNWPTGTLTVRE